ncbi:hypothetical protein [Natrarchaeobius chitinivorans]|uniref:Zinc ribbon domain-containing protein n=1 Tax=Natrarchaeobius chitinivorans TaxID=1679083 RepID=A0A3N6MKJ7_NATCH|nr:hypothetical protein [Natrarchaeobius chitinivorans]RQG94806.1 hypothetical protein EA473_09885 [Natrarchaeobius chitinivorans]
MKYWVYVHLNNDDVNQAIREQYGISNDKDEEKNIECSFCNAENKPGHTECRNCGRILSLKQETEEEEKREVLERLAELEKKGILDKIQKLGQEDAK